MRFINLKFTLFIVAFLAIILSFLQLNIFLQQDTCLDGGNVWDYDENRCREDCLNWNKVNGCIKLNAQQVRLFNKCRNQLSNCISKKILEEICRQNNLPFNKQTGECYAEFTKNNCYKLGENWIYPKICEETAQN